MLVCARKCLCANVCVHLCVCQDLLYERESARARACVCVHVKDALLWVCMCVRVCVRVYMKHLCAHEQARGTVGIHI